MTSIARNDPCPCGSGEKYKRCCMKTGGVGQQRRARVLAVLAMVVIVAAVVAALAWNQTAGLVIGGVGFAALGGWWLFTDPPPPRGGGNPGAINFGR